MAVLADINTEELHALKRKQLQSLCKKHGVKANGKSEELIERLTNFIKKGGSENDNNDGEQDDEDDDDDQRYDSATEEDKSGTLSSNDGQSATPAKLFKVVPLQNAMPVEMVAPESMTVVQQEQFSSQVEMFTAKLEARAAAIAADMAKDDVEKYNPAYGLDLLTPKSKKSAKTILFDRAHDKLFSNSDSILSHWSAKKVTEATTPSNKRTNDSSVLESNKRPRMEVLFESPSVQPQSAGLRRKSIKAKAMTAKARRTAAPGASLDGSKTVSADGRVKPTSDKLGLSSIRLFAEAPAEAEPSSEVEFAPLVDTAPCAAKESEPATEMASPKKSRSAKQVADSAPPASLAKSTTKKKTAGTLSKAATPLPLPPVATSEAPSVAIAEIAQTEPAAPVAAPKAVGTLPKPTPKASTATTAPVKPSADKESAEPASKPSQIPMARKIAKPKSIAATMGAATAPKKAAVDSKIQAPKKADVTKPTPKQATTKPSTAPASAATAPATIKPLASQSAGFRNVESKLKSYINSKPPSPKVKAVKHILPDPKNTVKPNPAAAKPAKSVKAPVAGTVSKGSPASKGVPNYMKPTRAKEIRSQQVTSKVLPKSESGKPTKTEEGKARFNPYNRPAKSAVAKVSAAK
ncbi:hypothetical protein GGI20_003197 [Coemansia sp. BCRC 34301]|nr:hypothetical protein GGI20_003197 [Coemansia sp. BCRC 34301]